MNRDQRTIPFGGRRHYDPLSRRYLDEAVRITTLYAQAFGQHPAVVGWQVDNEFGHHSSSRCYSEEARKQFRIWLKQRYETIDELNNAHFNAFWSMKYRDFSEIDPPWTCLNPPNPHLDLDYSRFMTEAYRYFQGKQVEVLKKLCKHSWVTHNLIPNFDELCLWSMTADLDYVGYDHYQTKSLPDPINSAVQFALMKSLKKGRKFFILEQQPLQVNWQKHNRRFDPDWIFLWGIQAALSGAEALLYFSWQRFYGGAEQYHDGIRSHDVRVDRTPAERAILAQKNFFQHVSRELGIFRMGRTPVTILVVLDFESIWAHGLLPQTESFKFWDLLQDWLEPLVKQGIGYMFVPSIKAAQDVVEKDQNSEGAHQIRGIFLPSQAFEWSGEERDFIHRFVGSGGHCVSMPRTAVKTKNNGMSPLPLWFFAPDDLCLLDHGAVSHEDDEWVSLHRDQDHVHKPEIPSPSPTVKTRVWSERIRLLDHQEPLPRADTPKWKVLGTFSRGPYRGSPAVIQKTKERQGAYTHFAFIPEKNSEFERFFLEVLGFQRTTWCVGEEKNSEILVYRWSDPHHDRCLAAINFRAEPQWMSLHAHEWIGTFVLGFMDHTETLVTQTFKSLEGLRAEGVSDGIRIPGRHVLFGRPRGT